MTSLLIPAILLTSLVPTRASISRVGNPVEASLSGVDVGGVTFLLNDVVLSDGVLFAFSAFFRADTPVRFQVWRPFNQTSLETYTLIGETRVIPSVKLSREDVYIASKLTSPCVKVQSGDRLGVFFEEKPSAIAYTFNSKDPKALQKSIDPNKHVLIGSDVTFDTLVFPYAFSVSAYIFSDPIYDNVAGPAVECPKDVLIPAHEIKTLPPTTRLPVTGRPGDTGATGPRGGIGLVGPQGATGLQGAPGKDGSTGPEGPQGAAGPEGGVGPSGAPGATGAAGPEGAAGATGAAGPSGAAGAKGDHGATGATGPRGERGERGPPGLPAGGVQSNGTGGPSVGAVSGDEMASPMMSYITLAWLALVSLLLLILLVLFVCAFRRRKSDPPRQQSAEEGRGGSGGGYGASTDVVKKELSRRDQHDKIVFSERPMSSDIHPDWTSTMKEDSEYVYPSDTISTKYSNLELTMDSNETLVKPTLELADETATSTAEGGELPREEVVNY